MFQPPTQPTPPNQPPTPQYACPNCWHHPHVKEENGGVATFALAVLINFRGGNLDKNNICNKCHWNYNLELAFNCIDCQTNHPCPKHYATIHNGTLHANMPSEMHRIYMRNSPYNQHWNKRPSSIGAWYAKQVTSCKDAITIGRRFTTNKEAIYAFNSLESNVDLHYEKFSTFWSGFHDICRRYFSGNDSISMAMNSYYHTLRSCKFLYPESDVSKKV